MSKTIDQKVVEMQFDNRQFERNVSTTMSSVEKLKQSLNFTGTAKGLEEVGTATKKVDMNGLGSAVDAVKVKFSALQVMGVTALTNITNSAVNAGKRMVSALTIDPIKTGFSEYETQINAIQTILANTSHQGTTLSQVSAALDELNKYADQTIYNFTEMTRNIGTFTAAGVDLDTSVGAIKGIANLAAVSGSTAQQASSAMYQLSQAIAAGQVTLQDWNSVVNAGMGGKVFQDALMNTAEAMGIVVDRTQSFRESISTAGGKQSWLTSEVLLNTLNQFTGDLTDAELAAMGFTEAQIKNIQEMAVTANDAATKVKTFTQLWDTLKESAQSGWTETWEIIVGDFDEAKTLLTELSETFGGIIGQSAENRNTLLYDTLTSNWKKLTDEINNAGISVDDYKNKIIETAKAQGQPIDDIIKDYGSLDSAIRNGAVSSDILNTALTKMTGTSEEITKKMDDLDLGLENNNKNLWALTNMGYGYYDAQELLAKGTKDQVIALNELSDSQLKNLGYTAEQIQGIRDLSQSAELAGGSLKTLIDNIAVPQGREMLIDTLRVSIRSLIDVFGAVGKAWRDVFPPMTSDRLLEIIQSVKDFTLALRPSEETLNKLQSTFRGLFSILSIAKQAVSALLSPIGDLIGHFTGLGGGILDATASLGDWLYVLDQSIKAGDSFSGVRDIVSSVVDAIGEAIDSVIGWFGGFDDVVSGIGDTVGKVFNAIKDTIGDVFDWIRENISMGDIFAGLAGGGIFMLAKKFGDFVDKIKDTIGGLFEGFTGGDGGGFSEILGSIHDSLESFQQGIQVASLVGIAAAVALLTSSLRKISELEPETIAVSLVTIRLMIASLNSGFKSLTKTLSKFNAKGTIKASLAMIAIAEAINILADAMVELSALSMEEIGKGLLAVGGALTELSLSMKLLNGTKINLRTSLAMIAIAQACKMLSEAVAGFAEFSWDEIGRGLTAMAGALGEVTAAVAILSKVGGGGALLGSAGIFITVQSLQELATSLKSFADMAWDEIGRGLTAMGGALAEVGVVTGALGKFAGFSGILGGGSLLIAVQSLGDLADALKKFGSMAWDEIGRGLAAMGGALAELGVVTGALGKLAGFSGIIGAGSLLIAVQGLGELADSLKKFGEMAWDEIGRGLTAMGGALLEVGAISGGLGMLAGFSGLFGAGTIWIAVQGLQDLATALQSFASMSWDEIGRGLVAMGGALLEVGAISGATGALTGIAGLVGAGTITLAVQGLGELADAMIKFGSMSWDEIGRGLAAMGGALGEVALGGLLSTFSGFGAGAIAEMAGPLGTLADSVKKWEGVAVPEGLDSQLSSLAIGVSAFNFSGWGAEAIAAVAVPIGSMADSIKKWIGVSIPETLGDQLSSLATGVSAFNFAGWGADAIAATAPALGTMADSIKKWQDVTMPENLGTNLESLATGVKAFSFAFVGGWSISSLVEPLANLADTVSKWNGVTIPNGIDADLQSLADGVGAFSLAFTAGWTIGNLVEPLAELADSVQKWNSVTLSGAGAGLSELATGLETLGEVGVKGIVKEFDGAADKIKASVGDMLDGITNAARGKEGEIVSVFERIVAESIDGISSKQGEFAETADILMRQFSEGIKARSSLIVDSFATMTSQAIGIIRQSYSSFRSAGSYLVDGFADGIRANSKKAKDQAKSLADSVTRTINNALKIRSPSRVLFETGEYVVQGLTNGISSLTGNAEGVSADLGNAVVEGITGSLGDGVTTSVVGEELGSAMVNGISSGITSNTSAEQAASDKAQAITEVFEKEFEKLDVADQTAELEAQLYNTNEDYTKKYQRQLERVELALQKYKTTLEVYGQAAIETQKAYNEYLQEEIDLRQLADEEAQRSFENSMNWIEKKKGASELSLIEELSAWKRVQARYLEGTEQRIQADEEVLRLQEEINNATEEYYDTLNDIQESANAERLQIDQDYEDERTQIEEDAENQRLQINQDYEDEKTRITEEANQKRLELDQEYADETQRINDQLKSDIESLEQAYEDAVQSRADSLYNTYGLFDQVKDGEFVSGEVLTENLKGQLAALEEWTKNINELAGKGLDEAFIEELREMGPSSAEQIKALNSMTDEELNAYVELWRAKHQLVKDQAVFEYKGLREETDEQIEQLKKDAETNLEELRETWQQQLQELDENTEDQLRELRSNWRQQLRDLDDDTDRQLREVRNTWKNRLEELDEQTNQQLEDLKTDWMQTVVGLKTETESQFTQMTANVINTLGERSQWTETGANMIEGVLIGVMNNTPKLVAGVEDAMREALEAAEETLGIASPSKKFARIGRYSVEGFAYGMAQYANLVTDSVTSIGDRTVNTLQASIARIGDMIDSGIDVQPTIRPVLDLSEIELGTKRLDTMFAQNQAVSIAGAIDRGRVYSDDQNGVDSSSSGQTFNFTQNNYSPKTLSRVDIYRQTKNQFSTFERMVKA